MTTWMRLNYLSVNEEVIFNWSVREAFYSFNKELFTN